MAAACVGDGEGEGGEGGGGGFGAAFLRHLPRVVGGSYYLPGLSLLTMPLAVRCVLCVAGRLPLGGGGRHEDAGMLLLLSLCLCLCLTRSRALQGYNGSQCWDTSFAVQAIG